MLNMNLPEITRLIGETDYKQEIDELGTTFKGIDLIEVALSWNLAKEYQKIQEITPGTLKQFTRAYLRRWDIQNVLTILKGRLQGAKTGKIKEILIPAGSLDKVALDRLLAEESSDKIVEMLKGYRMYPQVFAREYPLSKESGSYSQLENELYKQFYSEIIAEAESGIKGGKLFLDFIRLEIDIKNVKTLFRLRADTFEEDARAMYIQGGTLSAADFVTLNTMKDQNEFIDTLKGKIRQKSIIALLDELRSEKAIHDVESRLTRVQLDQMERMSKRNPISIHPILVYLEKKKYEVFNLRALARGKVSKLPSEKIAEYLVV
jgi:V/A-type H+-transporting ATPase subunit C